MQPIGDVANSSTERDTCAPGGADSPCSNASTHLSSVTDGEPARLSMDSLGGMCDLSEPSIIISAPARPEPCNHQISPLTKDNRPRHNRYQSLSRRCASRSAPRLAGLNATDSVLSSRCRQSGLKSADSTVSSWRHASRETFGYGHESLRIELTSPSPASYNPDDRLQAHHRRFPSATFGNATGHDLQCGLSSSPGPADFHGSDLFEARRRRSTSVAIGRGPGHDNATESPPKSPGPDAYNVDDKVLAGHRNFPTCAFGRSAGHASSVTRDSSPAPGSYNSAKCAFDNQHITRKGLSLPRAGRERASAEERLCFRRADQDSNGELDFTEVHALLQERFPDMRAAEVWSIFREADRNNDGKIDFSELLAYTHSTDPARRRVREKVSMALAAPRCSSSYREGQERMLFRKADLNLDGHLDMKEVESLMRRSFQDIKKRDVRDLFEGIDQNHDGKLDFHEVLQYTRSKDPSTRRLREKLHTALSAPIRQTSGDCTGAPATRTTGNSKLGSLCMAPRHKVASMHRSSSATTVGSLITSQHSSA